MLTRITTHMVRRFLPPLFDSEQPFTSIDAAEFVLRRAATLLVIPVLLLGLILGGILDRFVLQPRAESDPDAHLMRSVQALGTENAHLRVSSRLLEDERDLLVERLAAADRLAEGSMVTRSVDHAEDTAVSRDEPTPMPVIFETTPLNPQRTDRESSLVCAAERGRGDDGRGMPHTAVDSANRAEVQQRLPSTTGTKAARRSMPLLPPPTPGQPPSPRLQQVAADPPYAR